MFFFTFQNSKIFLELLKPTMFYYMKVKWYTDSRHFSQYINTTFSPMSPNYSIIK